MRALYIGLGHVAAILLIKAGLPLWILLIPAIITVIYLVGVFTGGEFKGHLPKRGDLVVVKLDEEYQGRYVGKAPHVGLSGARCIVTLENGEEKIVSVHSVRTVENEQ